MLADLCGGALLELQILSRSLVTFLQDMRGSVSLNLALSAVPLFAVAGGAIDYARWNDARAEVATALDAAVLAGTQELVESDGNGESALAVAAKYYDTVVSGKVPLNKNSVAFALNDTKTGVKATGKATIETSLLKIVGIDEIDVFAASESEAVEADYTPGNPGGDLEISVMLDVTGSMCNDGEGPCTTSTKLTGLKDAANKLVDTVVWDDQSTYTSRIAIVPFSTRVRVGQDGAGTSRMATIAGLPASWTGWYAMCVDASGSGASETGGNWTCNKTQVQKYSNWKVMPCVTDRFYNSTGKLDFTDAAPGPGKYLNAHDGSRGPNYVDSTNTKATSAIGNKKSDPAYHWNYEQSGTCYDIANANEVLPLTNDKTALKKKIDGLEAYGATGGVLGTSFSWYMLSPNWKSVWGGSSQPKAYSLLKETNDTGSPKLRKIAILMTDGVYNTHRGWKDQDINDQSANAIAMCAEMKKKGIEIYTVGFGLDELSAKEKAVATDTLKTCGTDIDHFYSSVNSTELVNAFETIGKKVSSASIRLIR